MFPADLRNDSHLTGAVELIAECKDGIPQLGRGVPGVAGIL
jgi:hypothetical protein